MRPRIRAASCLAAVLVLALGMPAGATDGGTSTVQPAQSHEVVATGLNNPRGLHAAGNVVYVAESGTGGAELVTATDPGGQVFTYCLGDSGSITRIDGAGQARLPASLPSISLPQPTPDGPACPGSGASASGPADVATLGATLLVSMSNIGAETTRDQFHPLLGKVLQVLPNGKHVERGDLAAYEEAHNPDGAFVDSNPYGITTHGGRILVADAAANAVYEINGNNVSVAAVIPKLAAVGFELPSCLPAPLPGWPAPGTPIEPESVPTRVVLGADGDLYVSTLPGFPFPEGSAKVLRVDRSTGEASVFAEGFSALTGMAVGPDGALYVAEMVDGGLMEATVCGNFVPGRILKLTDGGTEVIGAAPLIGGLAVTDDGSVLVSVNSPFPGAGQVWKFSQD